ncbi:MAG: PDDEXK nuclease domain-containing protein [Christensenellaceae bacterium]|jgi:predicted nuclease of restriction endonuclease-like (RecB) superfamily|nr:PDDEXK nuclease domain-containing protein [Christensenellaceae bacterium]
MDKQTNGGTELVSDKTPAIDEGALFEHVVNIIERRKFRAASYANSEVTLMFWEVGQHIDSVLLEGERAAYGRQIVATLSQQLMERYGNMFERTKITRMIKFAKLFPDTAIVATLSQQLSWSHFQDLLPIKSEEARLFYANNAYECHHGVRALRKQISRKAFERREIANSHITEEGDVPFNVFRDPYLLDIFGLKENYLEADLEKAIVTDVKRFILEFGHGFAFVDEQVRMVMDGDDFKLDLLFYNRELRRLVAVELKLGKFKPSYKGQMEFYLRWLDKFERKLGENAPIGLILCTEASRDQIELMELDKMGIAVAEYWTVLPSKTEFERKIGEIYSEAQERLLRRRTLPSNNCKKQIDYYLESSGDDDE